MAGAVFGYFIMRTMDNSRIDGTRNQIAVMLKKSEEDSENLRQKKLSEARNEINKLKQEAHKDIKERSAIAKFKVAGEDAYFLAWTTTPWTLPSNLCLCVNPKVDYVKIQVGDTVYILAAALVDKVFENIEGERKILATYKGKELEYKKYEPLYPFADEIVKKSGKAAHYVTCDDYVTTEDGTGIVHCAPAFGEDDNRVCKKYDIPFVQFVDGKGNMTSETYWAGTFVKDADPLILKDLKQSGKLFKAPT